MVTPAMLDQWYAGTFPGSPRADLAGPPGGQVLPGVLPRIR